MAVKKSQDVKPSDIGCANSGSNDQGFPQTQTDIEGMIADELLESVDWGMVRAALLAKAKAKFWAWFQASATAHPVVTNEIEAMAIEGGANEAITE